jgi:hypothetical protein
MHVGNLGPTLSNDLSGDGPFLWILVSTQISINSFPGCGVTMILFPRDPRLLRSSLRANFRQSLLPTEGRLRAFVIRCLRDCIRTYLQLSGTTPILLVSTVGGRTAPPTQSHRSYEQNLILPYAPSIISHDLWSILDMSRRSYQYVAAVIALSRSAGRSSFWLSGNPF